MTAVVSAGGMVVPSVTMGSTSVESMVGMLVAVTVVKSAAVSVAELVGAILRASLSAVC